MSGSDILFNSPALHSLKRSQLIRICKRHGIKATGKNTELIEKLKEYAQTVPPGGLAAFDVPTSEAEDEDGDDAQAGRHGAAARPSEPWSIIQEEDAEADDDNSAPQTLISTNSCTGEFGAEHELNSKNSVGSSIKAFASSLKRAVTVGSSSGRPKASSKVEVASAPAPQIASSPPPSSPEPETRPNTYCPDPALASSTIRLIPSTSNLLETTPSGDLLVPTKGGVDSDDERDEGSEGDEHLSGASQKRKSSLYPELPEFARLNAAATSTVSGGLASFNLPATFDPLLSPASSSPEFGIQPPLASPPSVPKGQDDIKAGLLEEMNRRMGVNPTTAGAVSMSIFESKPVVAGPSTTVSTKGASRFEKAHEEMFNKMDSILSHYAVRKAPRKSAGKGKLVGRTSKPRSSFSATPAAVKRRSQASLAASRPSGLLPKVVNAKTTSTKPTTESTTSSSGQSCEPTRDSSEQIVPGGFKDTADVTPKTAPSITIVAQPPPAAKKRLEQAKRRSSLGKATVGKANITGNKQPAAKPGKFSFLKAGASKLVKSLWGGGKEKKVPVETKHVEPSTSGKAPTTSTANHTAPQIFTSKVTADTFASESASTSTPTSHVAAAKAEVARRAAMTGPSNLSVSKKPSLTAPTQASAARAATIGVRATVTARPAVPQPSKRTLPGQLRKPSAGTVPGTRPPMPASFVTPSDSNPATPLIGSSKALSGPSDTAKSPNTLGTATSFGFGLKSAKRPSTLTAPTAASLARLQAKPTVNENSAASKSFGFTVGGPSTSPIKFPSVPTTQPGPISPLKPSAAVNAAEGSSMMDFEVPPPVTKSNSMSSTRSMDSVASLRTISSGSARRPRISRSKVIAKLDAKRAAASDSSPVKAPARRSQVSAVGRRAELELAVQASAKKAIRRSEIARRKSRAPSADAEWSGIQS